MYLVILIRMCVCVPLIAEATNQRVRARATTKKEVGRASPHDDGHPGAECPEEGASCGGDAHSYNLARLWGSHLRVEGGTPP